MKIPFDLWLFQLRRLGWPAAAGAVLLIGAAVAELTVVRDQHLRAHALRAEYAQLGARAKQHPVAEPADSDKLAGFYAGLRPPARLEEALTLIHASAHDNGLNLAHGDYRLSRESGGRTSRYQISLPVQGSYTQLRAWLAQVMNALPDAALEGITIKRDRMESEALNSQVRFALYLKNG